MRGRPRINTDRDAAIVAAYVAGETLQEVADRYMVTRERIRQIMARAGVDRRVWLGGVNLSDEQKGARRERLRFLSKYRMLERDANRNDAIAEAVAAGDTYSQAARKHGVSRNTVAGVCHRARARQGVGA